jgi:hypothetical protein
VGFNAMQPGKVTRADLLMLLAAVLIVGGLVWWAVR